MPIVPKMSILLIVMVIDNGPPENGVAFEPFPPTGHVHQEMEKGSIFPDGSMHRDALAKQNWA